ncbi:NDP-sugar epimerase, includes UDP-GlcNAc-inverting 4,6-dehydratase FlaA1 and capsular polysaccharide biosynthesis protein EpsC [Psychroflexus salarius]|uniref:NDP-sugar epimerase, includes UDP-GlcNAc-inverting 4,6-dehydratase FlaA1 and capsular polysaccharide biosynthesis protein EpsC n=1 Tax=Psychroflexus salarius TaxID=1155689 RepID=A0A1M4VT95_9FLAO|nr:nucleoside-diphosphate sugar epimerase/dehydratase [Psychroflexus salarius]SHE72023.1 NDP-sugar epimerase, includes UDP-GlcNAc-inverting 4,6-dehydratase FlaA1 and capsular polysaccharide biosynthesis protein EpsC [Psychroflexus salarius]
MLKLKLLTIELLKRLSRNYVPRYLIFAIDFLIAFVSAQATFFLISSIQSPQLIYFEFSWKLLTILSIQIIAFLTFKSYSGIVRYTGFRDAIKLIQTTIFSVAVLLIINNIYYMAYEIKIIVDAGLIMYGFILFSILFLFRIVVKRAYQLIHANQTTTNAYILGTGLADVAIAEGIISDTQTQFKLSGFVNVNSKIKRNRIFNLPIVLVDDLLESQNEQCVIINSSKLDQLDQSLQQKIDILLENNIKVYKLPEIQDWNDTANVLSQIKEINLEDLLQRNPIKLNKEKLKSIYQGKTILVTGAAGSIGSDIVRQLIPFDPQEILLLDQAETPLHDMCIYIRKEHPETEFKSIIADVRNYERLAEIFEEYSPEVVFHGAAYKHVPMMEDNPIEAMHVNYLGTQNLVNLASKHQVNRFVFVSTDKAVNPTNIMGATKRSAEIFVQFVSRQKNNKTLFITTRFGNVLGSNGSVIPHFKKQILQNGPVTVTHPEITRYFMTIDEACQLVLEAGALGKGGEIFVFDMGNPVKIVDLAKQMIRLSGFTPNVDINITYTGLRPGEKLYEELLADKENTLPTHHQKILIAKSSFEFDKENTILLENLSNQIMQNQTLAALKILYQLVPEFNHNKLENRKIG